MLPKRIATIVLSILVLFAVVIALARQVTPAMAGFTPVPTDTSAPPVPTDTPDVPVPTDTPDVPVPTDTPPIPVPTDTPPQSTPPGGSTPTRPASTPPTRNTPPSPPEITPEMPVTGGDMGGLGNSGIFGVLLPGMIALLLVAISLVIRQSARTKTKK